MHILDKHSKIQIKSFGIDTIMWVIIDLINCDQSVIIYVIVDAIDNHLSKLDKKLKIFGLNLENLTKMSP